MKEANIPDIIIELKRGQIQNVRMSENRKIRLRVRDFAVYDTDHPSVKFDIQGRPYEGIIW